MTDPLSAALALTGASSLMTGGFRAGGQWALKFPPPADVKLYAVLQGRCVFYREAERRPVELQRGDVVLICEPKPYIWASAAEVRPEDARPVFARTRGEFARVGTSAQVETEILGGHVRLNPAGAEVLRQALPPRVVLRSGSPEAVVCRQLLTQLREEFVEGRPGAELSAQLLTQLVFIQILRTHLANPGARGSWLRALADPQLAAAMKSMHSEPTRPWTLGALAKKAGMSRSVFAERFKQSAGVPPLSYLANWRMQLAQQALRERDDGLLEVALACGYQSASAFSNAFKRFVGVSPRAYRRAQRAARA